MEVYCCCLHPRLIRVPWIVHITPVNLWCNYLVHVCCITQVSNSIRGCFILYIAVLVGRPKLCFHRNSGSLYFGEVCAEFITQAPCSDPLTVLFIALMWAIIIKQMWYSIRNGNSYQHLNSILKEFGALFLHVLLLFLCGLFTVHCFLQEFPLQCVVCFLATVNKPLQMLNWK